MSNNTDFVAQARQKCAMSIRNTAVGDWLGDALRRLEEADAENERLRQDLNNRDSALRALSNRSGRKRLLPLMSQSCLEGGDS